MDKDNQYVDPSPNPANVAFVILHLTSRAPELNPGSRPAINGLVGAPDLVWARTRLTPGTLP